MMPPYSCAGARQEARHVDEGHDRDVEAVAEAHEARRLARAVDVEAAGQHHRLVGDDADGRALHAGEADHDVAGVVRLHLEEIALVDDLLDQLLHVVGLVGVGRHQRVERGLVPFGRVGGRAASRRLLAVRGGRKSTKRRSSSSASTSFSKARSATPDLVVWVMRAAQLLLGHALVGHGLHHVGAGDEHVGACPSP